jgi:hypothetical protein
VADESIKTTSIAAQGASRLPSVEVSFNVELKDEEGFLGDRASKGFVLKRPRKVAEGAAQIGRRPIWQGTVRKHQQEGP